MKRLLKWAEFNRCKAYPSAFQGLVLHGDVELLIRATFIEGTYIREFFVLLFHFA